MIPESKYREIAEKTVAASCGQGFYSGTITGEDYTFKCSMLFYYARTDRKVTPIWYEYSEAGDINTSFIFDKLRPFIVEEMYKLKL